MDKALHSRKELRSVLHQAKFFAFDQDGKCWTHWYGNPLVDQVYRLEGRLCERIADSFTKYFEGPGFLYIFKDIPQSRKFIEENMKNLDLDEEGNGYDKVPTLLMAIATTGQILQYDAQLIRTYLEFGKPEDFEYIKDFRHIKSVTDSMLLAIKTFNDK